MLAWTVFALFVFAVMALDLGVFNRGDKESTFKGAVYFSLFCLVSAGCFNLGIWYFKGASAALEFLAGYLVEESLSVDNIFIFLVIFSYFKVPKRYQHDILFWGVLGALGMRALFVAAGVSLLTHFHWVIYIFGAILIFTGIKMIKQSEEEIHPERNPILRLLRKLIPVTKDYEGKHFFVRHGGKLMATPLFVVLVVIETTDLIFAVDSIPAVLAITRDPFIVYTSNVFAIMGLRAMYSALSGVMDRFHLLHYGLAFILCFVGGKMLAERWIHVPIGVSLGVIAVALVVTVSASLFFPKPQAD